MGHTIHTHEYAHHTYSVVSVYVNTHHIQHISIHIYVHTSNILSTRFAFVHLLLHLQILTHIHMYMHIPIPIPISIPIPHTPYPCLYTQWQRNLRTPSLSPLNATAKTSRIHTARAKDRIYFLSTAYTSITHTIPSLLQAVMGVYVYGIKMLGTLWW